MSSSTLENEVSAVAARRRELEGLAEKIISGHVGELPPNALAEHIFALFTDNDRALFGEIGWNLAVVAWNFHRLTGVAQKRAIAGTRRDRESAARRLVEAESVERKRGPLIAAEIQRLTAEQASIRRAVADASEEVSRRTEACRRLRTMVPQSLKQQYDQRLVALKRRELAGEDVGRERAEAESMLDCYAD